MTESEWLESDDPNAMIHCCVSQSVPGNRDGLVLQPSTRKFRLFAAAAVRTCWNLLDRSSRAVVEAAERFADTGEVNEELFAASSLLTLARVLMPSPDCQETGEANAVVETASSSRAVRRSGGSNGSRGTPRPSSRANVPCTAIPSTSKDWASLRRTSSPSRRRPTGRAARPGGGTATSTPARWRRSPTRWRRRASRLCLAPTRGPRRRWRR